MSTARTIALALLTAGIGFIAGAWHAGTGRASAWLARPPLQAGAPLEEFGATGGATNTIRSPREELLGTIMGAMAESKPLLRAHLLHTLLGNLNTRECALLFEHSLTISNPNQRSTSLEPILARWAAIDANAARAAVAEYIERFRNAGGINWKLHEASVAQAWMKVFPEEWLTDAMAEPDTMWAKTTAHRALKLIGKGNLDRQLELLAALPESRLRDDCSQDALLALSKTDPLTAESRVEILSDPEKRRKSRTAILGKLAERDPDVALRRLGELAPTLSEARNDMDLVNTVLRSAAIQEPSAALGFVETLPELLRSSAQAAALCGWAEKNAMAALEWAVTNGVNVAECSARSLQTESPDAFRSSTLIQVALQNDARAVIAWVKDQPASAGRDQMLAWTLQYVSADEAVRLFGQVSSKVQPQAAWVMVSKLSQTSIENASAWVSTLPAGEVRASAIRNLVDRQASIEPGQVEQAIDAWSSPADRSAALAAAAGHLSMTGEVSRALRLAQQIPDTRRREGTLRDLLGNWASWNRDAARQWLVSSAPLSADQKRVLLRMMDEF